MKTENIDNFKKFTLIVTCYTEPLSIIENISEQDMYTYIKNYPEPLPKNIIEKALSELQIGEIMYEDRWHTNNSKLLTMIPKYHREIKLIRLA